MHRANESRIYRRVLHLTDGFGRTALRGEEGATLVEMAVACTILFAVMFAIIQMSLALYSYDYISEAAREAARYAIVRGSACTGFADCNVTGAELQSFVENIGYPGIKRGNLTVNTKWYTVTVTDGTSPTAITFCGTTPVAGTTTCNVPGNEVQVQVVYSFPFHIPFWNGGAATMQSTSAMIIAQ